MRVPIVPSALDSVLTIVFENLSRGGVVVVWVCANRQAYDQALTDLRAMPHVRVIVDGMSVVKR